MMMLFADRGIAGALTVGGAVFLTYQLGLSTSVAGMLPAIPLLLMAVFNGPVGWLADRLGLVRIRVVACIVYGVSFVALAAGNDFGFWWLYVMFAVMGLAGAGLIPTSFALGARAGGGTADMGLLQTADEAVLRRYRDQRLPGHGSISGESGLDDVIDERVVWTCCSSGSACCTCCSTASPSSVCCGGGVPRAARLLLVANPLDQLPRTRCALPCIRTPTRKMREQNQIMATTDA